MGGLPKSRRARIVTKTYSGLDRRIRPVVTKMETGQPMRPIRGKTIEIWNPDVGVTGYIATKKKQGSNRRYHSVSSNVKRKNP